MKLVSLLLVLSAGGVYAQPAMPLEEIARRLIRKAYEGNGRIRNPARVTFTSVHVNPQGTDSYAVNAKYTLSIYYHDDNTRAWDYDYHFVLVNQAGTWRVQEGDGTKADEPRIGPNATPPPPGETEVPAAPPDRSRQPDLLMSGNAALASSTAPAVTRPTQSTMLQAQREPSPSGQLKYKVGQPVDYVDNGLWYKAVIIKVRDDSADHGGKLFAPYRVHSLGYNSYADAWVCCADFTDRRSQLRPAGSGATEPVPGGEANDTVLKGTIGGTAATPPAATSAQPPAKHYHCVYFVGNQLVDAASFTITGNDAYTDSDGKRGTYSFNSASSILTFRGGNYDGQRAEYETKGGLPRLHILGPSGRRVIDCD